MNDEHMPGGVELHNLLSKVEHIALLDHADYAAIGACLRYLKADPIYWLRRSVSELERQTKEVRDEKSIAHLQAKRQ